MMDRVETSTEYAAACQRVIGECEEDYKKGSEQIEHISAPAGIHPMLMPINDLAYDIVADFRGDESDRESWDLIKTKVARFLTGDWEPTIWWAMVMYGFEENRTLRHSYSLSIRRHHGATMEYESGNDELVEIAKSVAESINPRQTDEWFMYTLLQQLPKEVGELTLQSTHVYEITIPERDK